jgi:hypothetical protein
MKSKYAICYCSVGELPRAKAEIYMTDMLKKLKDWMPEVKWLIIPRRDCESYIEFIPED